VQKAPDGLARMSHGSYHAYVRLCSVMVASQAPLAARLGHVLGWCTGDNQPSLTRPRYRPIGSGFSGLGWPVFRPDLLKYDSIVYTCLLRYEQM